MNLNLIAILIILAGVAYGSLLIPGLNMKISKWLVDAGLFQLTDRANMPDNLLGSPVQKFMYALILCGLGAWLLFSSLA